MEKLDIEISTEYIKLDQLLKFSAVAENGAHAKDIILNDNVLLNGVRAVERGRKIRTGDVVTVGDIEIHVC